MIWTTGDIVAIGLCLIFIAFCCLFRMGIFGFFAGLTAMILVVQADENIWRALFIALAILSFFLAFMRKELQD